ncbi:cyclic pyranopterin monophosphate synthase MoaC [Calycomorphotria hydatis]|uniref:Cyclic pyranopterin monophosphate synthase n=1 Tax=Calycomorphotria hydatis TaxID=2528027 RepID=A0A517TCG1_9PLAN|nr:Cyclic pyranopterin monophosphate synthase accessory protein [Calycomorphotria hydatis]
MGLTHFDDHGHSRMVDVTAKPVTERLAVAEGTVQMSLEAFQAVMDGQVAKGNVLEVARLAGIMGTKRTADLIPLCHPLPIDGISIEIEPLQPTSESGSFRIAATVKTSGRTGVEMEALTAVSVTGLTIYDMCKSLDRSISIGSIQLLRKSGGKSGDYTRPDSTADITEPEDTGT